MADTINEESIVEYADNWARGDVKSLQTEIHPALKANNSYLGESSDMTDNIEQESLDESLLGNEHSYSQPEKKTRNI